MTRIATKDKLSRRLEQAVVVVYGVVLLLNIDSAPIVIASTVVAIVLILATGLLKSKPEKFKLDQLKDGLVLGPDAHGQPVVLYDRQLAAHGLILGATGAGKTTSLLTILYDEIRRGRQVIAIDLKGSRQFADVLANAAHAAGRPFQQWTPEGPGYWNPLRYGDATELKDKLISTERWSEPHYQRAAERYVQTALQVLQIARPDKPPTLAATVNLLDEQRLQSMLSRVPRELANRVGPYISGLNRDQRSAISGLESRLAVMSESAPGQYLQPGEPEIDLRHTLTAGSEVVVFSLNASRYGKLAAQIAALVIQDLISIAAARLEQPGRPLALVAIDEFSALDADNLLNILARGRESGISVLLSTQEIADLERLAPGFRDQVLGNTAITIAHRQNVPDSAELIARMIGTHKTMERTYQTERTLLHALQGKNATGLSGKGTIKQVDEFRIHPNTIKELQTGHAILITKIPTAAAQLVQIIPGPRTNSTCDGH